MKKLTIRIGCLVLAAGAAPSFGQILKAYTVANKTGVDANDFHVTFDRNASPPTVAPAATVHSNDIQDNTGASRGTFPRPATSGSAPLSGLSSNILDYTGPSAMVRNNDQLKIVVPFPGRTPGRLTSAYFTFNGVQIAGRVEQVSLNESFSRDAAGLCSLDLDSDPGSPAYTVSNIRLWAGLNESQMFNYGLLSSGSATVLGSVLVSPGSPAHFSIGTFDPASFAVVTYDLSYFDSDIGSIRMSAGSVYGSAVPAPGSLALLAGGLLAFKRRRS